MLQPILATVLHFLALLIALRPSRRWEAVSKKVISIGKVDLYESRYLTRLIRDCMQYKPSLWALAST